MSKTRIGMNKVMEQFLQKIDSGEVVANDYPLPGIITQCEEWMCDGWEVRNDTLTGPMYAAALLNEASTQDECVKRNESHPELPKTLRLLAFRILAFEGHIRQSQQENVFQV